MMVLVVSGTLKCKRGVPLRWLALLRDACNRHKQKRHQSLMDGCQNYGPLLGVHIRGDVDIDVDTDTDS